MAERRPLAAAVNHFAGADPEDVRAFITQEPRSQATKNVSVVDSPVLDEPERDIVAANKRQAPAAPVKTAKKKPTRLQPVGLIPVTIRLRPEIAGALKRASLERQLTGEDLFTQQDIVENALEPWLESEGYM